LQLNMADGGLDLYANLDMSRRSLAGGLSITPRTALPIDR